MKKLVNVVEVENEGLAALLGEHVMIFCANYIYAGTLTGVNDTCVLLEDAKIVYETGSFSDANYKHAETLPTKNWYIARSAMESFGLGKKGR
jgi:hypothetical protein